MTMRAATTEELDRWDVLLASNPDGGNVFQSTEMAETKRNNGWLPRYFIADTVAVTVLEKTVFGLGKFWYMPKGPGVLSTEALLPLIPSIKECARHEGVFAVKIEPEIVETNTAHAALEKASLFHTHAVQPNSSTVILDLSPTLDELMTTLNQKGRHAIHRAERDGVIAKPVELTEENMHLMFNLLTKTAAGRFDASLRTFDYYKKFWQSFANTGHGSLFFAKYEGNVVAAAYCMYLGSKGLYKDGASVREKTAYGASHLLQWEVIKWMKDQGVTSYDLCGAPHSNEINDEQNPFYGIGRFKTSFNKHVTDYVGCYDIVIDPHAYRRWQQFGQRMTVSLSWRIKHRQWF